MVAQFRGVSNKLIQILYIASIFAIVLGSLTAIYLVFQLITDKDLTKLWRFTFFVILILDVVGIIALVGYIYKIKFEKDDEKE